MKNRRKSLGEKTRKKQQRILIALLLFINFYLILSSLFGEMGLINALQLKKTYVEIRHEVESLDNENELLLAQIDALRNDPRSIERLAREQLGLAKEGELIYLFFDSEPL